MTPSNSDKNKMLFSGAITVALVALVLMVLGLFGPLFGSGKKGGAVPASTVVAPAPAQTSGALVDQALAARQSGDLSRTAELARAAVAADPSNTTAKALLDGLSENPAKPKTPAPAKQSKGSMGSVFLKPIADLASLLPTSFADYDMGLAAGQGPDYTNAATAVSPTAPVPQIIWAVHDLKTEAEAARFIERTSKVSFPKDASEANVLGVPAYFGTDGERFANISFVRGRFVFEVQATTEVAPSSVKPLLLKAAAAFAASR